MDLRSDDLISLGYMVFEGLCDLREAKIRNDRALVESGTLRADCLRSPDCGEHPKSSVLERSDDLSPSKVELVVEGSIGRQPCLGESLLFVGEPACSRRN